MSGAYERDWRLPILALAILGLIAAVFWPALNAGFVWLDKIYFLDTASLRHGDRWRQLIFYGFGDWQNYFRPLVVALFVAEARAFDAHPGPMHAISLLIQLANTALVGALASRLPGGTTSAGRRLLLIGAAMTFYGVHAALVEPVTWISSQFNMLVTFFVLLGLLINIGNAGSILRAIGVGVCFLLAACAKEEAAVFPFLLVLVDWLQQIVAKPTASRATLLRDMCRRQWPIYIAVFAAGIGYLAFRYLALGFLVHGDSATEPLAMRWQTPAFLLITYWRILLWPFAGPGPLHVMDDRALAEITPAALGMDFAALLLLFSAAALTWKRKPFGVWLLAASIAVLPVLHVIPIEFDISFYHERYALLAVAVTGFLLPSVLAGPVQHLSKSRTLAFATAMLAASWTVGSIANIRIMLPIWSDDVKLWSWALMQHPGLAVAENHLLAAYVDVGDKESARAVADTLVRDHPECVDCMLSVAGLAVDDGDVARLRMALEYVRRSLRPPFVPRIMQNYAVAIGQLHELEGATQAAIDSYQDAIRMDPLDPLARLDLALLLARHGQVAAARKHMDEALQRFAPDRRAHYEEIFKNAAGTATAPNPSSAGGVR